LPPDPPARFKRASTKLYPCPAPCCDPKLLERHVNERVRNVKLSSKRTKPIFT
jgi:hypothetical protein